MRIFSNRFMRIIFLLGMVFSLSFNLSQVNANSNNPPLVSSIDREIELPTFNSNQVVGDAKTQKLNLNINAINNLAHNLISDQVLEQTARFQLFPDLTIDATFEKVANTIQTGYFLSGIINNDTESSILLTSTDGVIGAKFDYQGKQFFLYEIEDGSYQVEEIDQSQFPSEIDILPDSSQIDSDFEFSTTETLATDSGNILDVLVVYTAAARSGAGGTTNMINLINIAINETNLGYERSGIYAQMRLVHTAEINYDESILSTSTGWGNALSQLTNQDNIIDEVRSMRNTYGADLVVMIVNNMNYCGIGWLMTPSYTFDSVGNSLVSRACATGYYSFAHETGHNMGAHHDRQNTGGGTAMYSYSYGYQDPNATFRTIMSYNCSSGCPRINNWSNPDVLYNGRPTGVVSTASNSADNRQTLNNTASIVSNFRASKVVPEAPTNLVIQDVKSSRISVTFIDNSLDEQGFKVDRSTDGSNWSSFLTLSQNSTSFEDQSPVCGGQFFYRVYAYNQNGNSSYSNSATTGLVDCTPPPPLTDIDVFASISSITLNWSSNDESISYQIQIEDELTHSAALDQGFEISQLPLILSGLEKGTTYIITITASNEFGTTVNDPISVKTMSEVIFLPLTSKQ